MQIAEVLKPQGIKGELKLKAYTDSAEMLAGIKEVLIGDKKYAVEKIRSDGDFAYAKFVGIDDRNAAETLRGKSVEVDAANKPKPEDGRFFVEDVIGCRVTDANKDFGAVIDILQYGAADVYCVKSENKSFMFPAIAGVVLNCDIEAKVLTVDAEALQRVAVYED